MVERRWADGSIVWDSWNGGLLRNFVSAQRHVQGLWVSEKGDNTQEKTAT